MEIFTIDINNETLINNILLLSDKVFGKGFLSKNDLFKQIFLSKKGNIFNSIALIEDDKLIGYGISYFGSNLENENILVFDKNIDLAKTSYIKTILIDLDFQGNGYGKLIIDKLIENSIKVGDKNILLHVWAESPNNSSFKFFEKYGAKFIQKYENRWYKDSLENKWNCSKCGNPCTCSSIEMIINL